MGTDETVVRLISEACQKYTEMHEEIAVVSLEHQGIKLSKDEACRMKVEIASQT